MSYYKLQSIFVFTLCSVYLIVTQISYRVHDHSNFTKELNYFNSVVFEKNELIRGIQRDPVFSHYPKKLKILEVTSNPFLQKLTSLIQNKNWKSKISSLSIPFKEQSCLIIGKNGRKLFKSGNSMNDVFTSSWDKSIFIALKHKNTIFRRMNAIYHHPIDIDEFQAHYQKFQLLYHKDQQFIYKYYTKVNNLEVFYFLKLNMINHQQLNHMVQSFFVEGHKGFSTSKSDSIIWNNKTLTLGDNINGLHYHPKSLGYLAFIKTLVIQNCIFLFVFILLYYKGGYRVIASYFEFKFILIYLFFIYMLFLLFVQTFSHLKDNRRTLSKQQLEKHWDITLKKLEDRYFSYKQKLTKDILYDFNIDQPFKGNIWNKKVFGLSAKKGKSQLSSNNMDPFNHHILNNFVTFLSNQSESFPIKTNDLNIVSTFFKLQETPNDNGILSAFSSRSNLMIKNSELFSNQSKGKFVNIPVVGGNLEILFDTKGAKEDFQALLVKSTIRDLQSSFFDHLIQKSVKASLFIKSKSSRYFKSYNFSDPVSSQEFQGLQSRFLSNMGGLNKFSRKNKNYFAMFLKSDVFETYDMFFIIPEDKVFESVQKMNSDFKAFLWLFYLVILVIPLLLSRLILKPIHHLKQGLLRVKQDSLLPIEKIQGKDESAELLLNFNSMILELQRKEAMLPFVSNAIFNLLTDSSGEMDTDYSGNAVVLFSDIKSFTSISETRDPQEVVDMLNDYFSIWQEKIEKNGGIVDRFIGDAISVVYFEKSSPHFVQQAIQTSVEVMEALEKFNETRREKGEFLIENGVGLCYGEVYFSMVGDQNKMEFLIQGTPVALSEYLEGQSRHSSHSHIILDPYIKEQVNYQYDFAPFEVENRKLGSFYELIL